MVRFCVGSVKNSRHSKQFKAYESAQGRKIGKYMGILSGSSYTSIWVLIIVLLLFRQGKFILPVVTLIIGVHFIPQAKIMNRKIDYFVAPVSIISSTVAFYFAFTTNMNWMHIFSVVGVGGAIAAMIYGFYMIYLYKKTTKQYQMEYK